MLIEEYYTSSIVYKHDPVLKFVFKLIDINSNFLDYNTNNKNQT